MPDSPIRKLAPLAEAAKERGIHVYHLNIGQPDLPTPRAALDAIRNIDRKVLEYSPSQGYRSYRERLVGYYEKGMRLSRRNRRMPTTWRLRFRQERLSVR